MDILLRKKASASIFLKQKKHDDFGVCSLSTKSFYHGLTFLKLNN